MLNIGVICALLVTIQLTLVVYETPVHPVLVEALLRLERAIWGGTFFSDDGGPEKYQYSLLAFLIQQAVSVYIVPSITNSLLLIMESAKAYGHLMYWSADLETKVWYSRSKNILQSQGVVNGMAGGFIKSLLPYIFVSRGPIIGFVMMYFGRMAQKDYAKFNSTGSVMIQVYQAMKIQDGMLETTGSRDGATGLKKKRVRGAFNV